MNRSTLACVAALVAGSALPSAAAAQRSDLSVSPFVSLLPAVSNNPLAGIALTLAGKSGLSLRASGQMAVPRSPGMGLGAATALRAWGADADALLTFGSLSGWPFNGHRGFSPFVFAGVGVAARDSGGHRITRPDWSYGAGATVPLGRAIELFGEARWRMSRYVLPTAASAPSPTNEVRLGLSFHVGQRGAGAGWVAPTIHGAGARSSARNAAARKGSTQASRRAVAFAAAPDVPASVLAGRGATGPAGRAPAGAARVIATAAQYVGAPYRLGGTSPASGFDAPGFVQYVFAQQGVLLPRSIAQQARVGTALAPDWRAVSAGDLVIFEDNGRVDHVAIYAGGNRIIHATATGGGVRFDDLSTPRGSWFVDHMVSARRIAPDALGRVLDLTGAFRAGLTTRVEPRLEGPDRAPRPR